jgi:hypothetical protein
MHSREGEGMRRGRGSREGDLQAQSQKIRKIKLNKRGGEEAVSKRGEGGGGGGAGLSLTPHVEEEINLLPGVISLHNEGNSQCDQQNVQHNDREDHETLSQFCDHSCVTEATKRGGGEGEGSGRTEGRQRHTRHELWHEILSLQDSLASDRRQGKRDGEEGGDRIMRKEVTMVVRLYLQHVHHE